MWLLLAALVMRSLLVAGDAEGYDPNVHYELTRFLAVSAGFKDVLAVSVARGDEGVDDDPRTSPWSSIESRELYHFVSSRRLADLREDSVSTCDTHKISVYMHALEDSFPHEGFRPLLGHFPDPTPDWAWWDLPRAMQMAKIKFSELLDLGKWCSALANQKPRNWKDIETTVHDFLQLHNDGRLP